MCPRGRLCRGEMNLLRWMVAAGVGLQLSCAHSLRRNLRRGDLAAMEALPESQRQAMSSRQAMRYAKLLSDAGRIEQAERWWLRAYLRGADLKGLEALASSEANRGALGFSAAHFAQILATERGAIQDRALACRVWKARERARMDAALWVAAHQDLRRLQSSCASRFYRPHPNMDAKRKARRFALARPSSLMKFLPAALTPSFLPVDKAAHGASAFSPARVLIDALDGSPSDGKDPLSREAMLATQGRSTGAKLARAVGEDPLLGAKSAAWTALLAIGGQHELLDAIRDKMRASTSLQSLASAHFRVVLALVAEGQDEAAAVFWMRLGASESPNLGEWWLWCARWAEWSGQRDAARVAYQALAKLVEFNSPAAQALGWLRLRHRLLDLLSDPYLQDDAPHQQAQVSVRALWNQYLDSLPEEKRSEVLEALLEEWTLAGLSSDRIDQTLRRLLGDDLPEQVPGQLAAAAALAKGVARRPRAFVQDPDRRIRGAAWRKIWQRDGRDPEQWSRDWPLFLADPVWSPRVDPMAAFTVLFHGPPKTPVLD